MVKDQWNFPTRSGPEENFLEWLSGNKHLNISRNNIRNCYLVTLSFVVTEWERLVAVCLLP